MVRTLSDPGQVHVMLDLAGHGLPEVPLLGIHKQPWAKDGLTPHRHAGTMEICYLVRGELAFQVGGQDCHLRGNDIFWTHAGERHSSGRNPFGKSLLYWLQLKMPARPGRFLTLDGDEAWPLVCALRSLPQRHFRGSVRLKAIYEEAFDLARQPASRLGRLALANRLVEWLRVVAECGGESVAAAHSPDIVRALELLGGRVQDQVSISDLAAAANLSESRFKAKFREQMGMPPGEYLLRRKVRRAGELLAGGDVSVTEVAQALGFSSSQYFATVFRRYRHQRPSDLLRRRPEQGQER
jgi:AraC-like DNA-binding protein/mannose-6-phosphate isomerase-like protein (cupin superfamily)